MVLGAQDYAKIRYGDEHGVLFLEVLSWSLVALSVLVALTYPFMDKLPEALQYRLGTVKFIQFLVAMTFASTIAFALTGALVQVCDTANLLVPTLVLMATFFTGSYTTYHLALTARRTVSKGDANLHTTSS